MLSKRNLFLVGSILVGLVILSGFLHLRRRMIPDIPPSINIEDDRAIQTTSYPQGDDYPLPHGPQRTDPRERSKCMVGCNPEYPLCSGSNNPQNITAPVPSPAWQPQSASAMQARVIAGDFTPSFCPQGPVSL